MIDINTGVRFNVCLFVTKQQKLKLRKSSGYIYIFEIGRKNGIILDYYCAFITIVDHQLVYFQMR